MPIPDKVPRHLAIIMDGNGRWAKRRGRPRLFGHKAGAAAVDRITREARRLGIEYLTLYAFSEQNWERPRDEVSGLMSLLSEYLRTKRRILMENDIRLRAIGDTDRLPAQVRTLLRETMELTRHNDSMTLTLALSYGGQEEIVQAARAIMELAAQGRLRPKDLDTDKFGEFLPSSFLPPVDLMVRTSGEERISNFLPWQLAYAELYFTPTLWPDFDEEALAQALQEYAGRERRFGLTSEQING